MKDKEKIKAAIELAFEKTKIKDCFCEHTPQEYSTRECVACKGEWHIRCWFSLDVNKEFCNMCYANTSDEVRDFLKRLWDAIPHQVLSFAK